jgi:23S rRNA pseudouridine2605 synthase
MDFKKKPGTKRTTSARPSSNGRKTTTSGSKFTKSKPFAKKDSASGREGNAEGAFTSYRKRGSDGPKGKRTYGEKHSSSDRPEKAERSFNTEKPFKSDRSSNTDRPFRSEKSPRNDRPFKSDKSASSDKPFKSSKPYERKESSNNEKPKKNFSSRSEKSFDGEKSFKSDKPFKSEKTSGDKPYRSSRPYERKESSASGKPKRVFEKKNTDYTDSNDHDQKEGFEKKSYSRDRGTSNKPKPIKANDGLTRLNKVIASSGVCSRREADDMIVAGLVSVNGTIVTTLGAKIGPEDDVRYNGERMKKERMVYILLNKPKDYITTMRDPNAKRTVLELIEGACKERVYPVGRLDRNTTGVLLLTNDGDLAKKLTHPSYNRKKIYHVHLDQSIRKEHFEAIVKGFELEDGFVKADELSFIDPADKKQLGIEVHSGRNRIVRRIFEHFEYTVSKLDRVYFSGLTKKGLQRGHWRFLTENEVNTLKMGSYE